MNLAQLAIKNVKTKALGSSLSILLFGFGIAIIVLILLVSTHLKKEITKNASGIDLVVGAKGSPMQLILANIFHVDFPTGNISLKESAQLTRNRLIKKAIPLSLGDSYSGFRIVGTTQDYLDLYQAAFASGEWNDEELSAFLGANVAAEMGVDINDTFHSTHGMAETGAGHDDHPFRVAGVLDKTGSVVDGLIIVSIQSVWHVHGHGDDHEEHADSLHSPKDIPWLGLSVTHEQFENEDITAMLIQYASPMAAIRLPQMVNKDSNFQAASPAFETARLFNLIGTGVEVVNILGMVIIIISAISVFIALINSLRERKYELAIMRTMGASRIELFVLVMLEGLILTLLGILFGFSLAHLGIVALGQFVETVNFEALYFVNEELDVALGALGVGIVSAIVPALMAYKADISKTLAKG